MRFVTHRLDRQLRRKPLVFEPVQVSFVVIPLAEHRKLAGAGQLVDVVVVRRLVGRLPGRHLDGVQRRDGDVDYKNEPKPRPPWPRRMRLSNRLRHGLNCTAGGKR